MFLRRTWAEIDTNALISNFKLLKNKSEKIMAVVKADAYGHNVGIVAPLLDKAGVDCFAVSNIEEAVELRKLGTQKNVLILGYTPPEAFNLLCEYDISQTVYDYNTAVLLSETAKKHNKCIKIHIKLDTGMSRLGFNCQNSELFALEDILKTLRLENLCFEGVFTHFAVSDGETENEKEFTIKQYNNFVNAVDVLKDNGFEPTYIHCNNSAGVMNYGFKSSVSRCGIALYGLDPKSKTLVEGLTPVMSFKSVVSFVKEIKKGDTVSYGRTFKADKNMKTATVSVGYADGYPRLASNKAYVVINGKKAKVLGRVCMDQLVVDVTDIETKVGDEVLLFGKNLPVELLAECAETINYEIVCGITKRVPRVPK